jgi:hypothetical protein
VEVTIVCAIVLVALAIVAGLGLWHSAGQCYASHPGEAVRWSFPAGCQLDIAGNLVPLDRAQPSQFV